CFSALLALLGASPRRCPSSRRTPPPASSKIPTPAPRALAPRSSFVPSAATRSPLRLGMPLIWSKSATSVTIGEDPRAAAKTA
ncbi:MAG: hypothetical protein AVDCRST_MAG93-5849, partial [uncultured Chloroflexia bacterium]